MTPPDHMTDHGGDEPTLLFTVDPGTHSATITDLVVADRGIVTVGMDKRIRWWGLDDIDGMAGDAEARPRTMVGQIGPGGEGAVLATAVRPAHETVVTAVRSGPAGGSVLRLRTQGRDDWQQTYRWPGSIADLAFSADGTYLLVASTGSDQTSGSDRSSSSDRNEGPRLEVFRFDDFAPVLPDDSGGPGASDGSDSSDGQKSVGLSPAVQTPPVPLHSEPLIIGPAKIGVGPDVGGTSKVVVTPTFVGRPQLFDLSAGALVEQAHITSGAGDGSETGMPAVGLSASVALTENHIAIAGENTGLTILDGDGRLVVARVPDAGGGKPVGVAFSPDGSLLVVGSRAGARSEVTVHDVGNGGAIVGRRTSDDNTVAVGFLSNYRVVCAGGSRFSIHTWDPMTTEARADDWFLDGAGQVIDAVGVSGSHIGFGNPDPVRPNEPRGEVPTLARRFDLDLLSLVPGAEEPAQAVPLDDFERAVHRRETIGALELDQGHVFVEPAGVELATGAGFSTDQATSYGVVGDDRVIVGRRSGAVALYDPPKAGSDDGGVDRVLPQRRLVGHVSAVLDLAAGEQWVVTAGRDQVMRLWPRAQLSASDQPATDLEPVLSLFVTATNEWIIWSKSGYYASSQNGDRYISYHYNRGEAVPARAYRGDQFVKNLYRPDVIRSILDLGNEAAALEALAVSPFSVEGSLPPEVRIVERTVAFDDDQDVYELEFEVTDAATPTTKITVLQNGIPAFDIDVADTPGVIVNPEGPVRRYQELIFLEPGDNTLSVVAENEVARSAAEYTLRPVLVAPSESVMWPPDIADDIAELPVEAVQVLPEIEEDLTRGRVVGAELNLALQIIEGDEPLTIAAIRNDKIVWTAETGSGVGFDGHLVVPLHRGPNNIEVLAVGETANGVLFSGQVDVTPRYTVEAEDHVGDEPPPGNSAGPQTVPGGDTEGGAGPMSGLPIGVPGGTERSPGLPNEAPETTNPNEERVHVVIEGETLRLLAKRYYDHESRYPLIFEANPSLADLDRLVPGTELVIPVLRSASDEDHSADEVDLAGWRTVQEVTARPQPAPLDHPNPGRNSDSDQNSDSASSFENTLSSDPGIVQESDPMGGSRKGTSGTPRDLPPDSDSTVPNLYLLSIGVSNLASRSEGFTNLSWPGDDAAAIAERFLACQGDQFGQVHQIGLGPRKVIEGADATKANIEQAVDDLAAALKARAAQKRADRVGTTDVTVVFFSGHGMSRAAEGEQEGLFLIPHDYDQDRWQETSVSLLGVAETLCTLPKTELIIFIDACRSGFAGTDFAQRIKPEQFGKRVEAISPRTIYVLSSTARDLDSWEFGLKYPYSASAPDRQFVGHGLFTHAILKRMDEADQANRGLSVLELGAAIHRQFETWRSWKAFADIDVRQDPWYQFHRSVRHFEFYRKSR